MRIESIASFAVITPDVAASRALYVDALGLPLEGDDYVHSEAIDGAHHFGVWPLTQAAEACFGEPLWPGDVPIPQSSVEFEVGTADGVQTAADELRGQGYSLLHDARTEPWGQIVARLLSPENVVVGISHIPERHR